MEVQRVNRGLWTLNVRVGSRTLPEGFTPRTEGPDATGRLAASTGGQRKARAVGRKKVAVNRR